MSKLRIPHLPHAKAVVAAGVSAAVIGSGAMAYAAIGPSSSAPTAALTSARLTAATNAGAGANAAGNRAARRTGTGTAGARRAPLRQLGRLAIGEVTSLSTSGGAASAGTITIQTPDSKSVTANLATRTRVVAYQGPGTKPTPENLSTLETKTDELVAVRIVARKKPTASTATGTQAPVRYAVLIVDLGYAAGTPTS